jgi:glycosyltransferase involved in cell wall biosynthesis
VNSEDFHPLDTAVRRHRLNGPWLRQMRVVRKLLQQESPDVAVGVMCSAYVPLAFAGLGSRIPLVASEHTAWAYYRAHPAHRTMLRMTVGQFAAMTIPSELIRQRYPTAIGSRMRVIPNLVAPSKTTPELRPRARKVLLAVGNLREEKGHSLLVSAFASIADRHPDWMLRIVGEGKERAALERQVRTLGLAGRVDLPGTVPDVWSEYAGADLFAMPSYYESFGLATAEALSVGLPAIGFADCFGTNELIAHESNGILVGGPDRVQALADGLDRLMRSDALREQLGQAGPASVASYSVESAMAAWEELLEKVAAGGSALSRSS